MKNVVTIILIAFSVICLLNPKIRVTRIIKGHFDSLRNDKTGKRSLWDLATFLVLPMVIYALSDFLIMIVSWLVKQSLRAFSFQEVQP